jgi:hypothetical protein
MLLEIIVHPCLNPAVQNDIQFPSASHLHWTETGVSPLQALVTLQYTG